MTTKTTHPDLFKDYRYRQPSTDRQAGGGYYGEAMNCPDCIHRETCGLYAASKPVSVTSCIRFRTILASKNQTESDLGHGKS